MTEIEQLRQDIATLETAERLAGGMPGQSHVAGAISSIVYDKRAELAKLEAEAAEKADPWAAEKSLVKGYLTDLHASTYGRMVAKYAQHLEQRVAELEKQLASEKQQVDNVDSVVYVLSNDLEKAQDRIAELEAELAKRPVVYCIKNNLTGIYGKHFGLDRIALFDIENPEVLAEWQSEPYTGEQS